MPPKTAIVLIDSKTARANKTPIFYGLHQQWTPHAYHDWHHMTRLPSPEEEGGDVVVSRHWNSNSLQNTDLDFQLGQRGITHLVFAGLTANTCLEASARHAYEL
ncbi:Isochorismatase-like protein [Aspergillus spectabilis]